MCMSNIVKLPNDVLVPKEEMQITMPRMSVCFFQADTKGKKAPFFLRALRVDESAHSIISMYVSVKHKFPSCEAFDQMTNDIES